jgi:hypothetical protein
LECTVPTQAGGSGLFDRHLGRLGHHDLPQAVVAVDLCRHERLAQHSDRGRHVHTASADPGDVCRQSDETVSRPPSQISFNEAAGSDGRMVGRHTVRAQDVGRNGDERSC